MDWMHLQFRATTGRRASQSDGSTDSAHHPQPRQRRRAACRLVRRRPVLLWWSRPGSRRPWRENQLMAESSGRSSGAWSTTKAAVPNSMIDSTVTGAMLESLRRCPSVPGSDLPGDRWSTPVPAPDRGTSASDPRGLWPGTARRFGPTLAEPTVGVMRLPGEPCGERRRSLRRRSCPRKPDAYSTISKRTAPSAKMSLRASAPRPESCSGAI